MISITMSPKLKIFGKLFNGIEDLCISILIISVCYHELILACFGSCAQENSNYMLHYVLRVLCFNVYYQVIVFRYLFHYTCLVFINYNSILNKVCVSCQSTSQRQTLMLHSLYDL